MRAPYACSKLRKVENVKRFSRHRDTVVAMITISSVLVSLLSFRVRGPLRFDARDTNLAKRQ